MIWCLNKHGRKAINLRSGNELEGIAVANFKTLSQKRIEHADFRAQGTIINATAEQTQKEEIYI
jgi:hypothetical protein